jgi:hypothetical protein
MKVFISSEGQVVIGDVAAGLVAPRLGMLICLGDPGLFDLGRG